MSSLTYQNNFYYFTYLFNSPRNDIKFHTSMTKMNTSLVEIVNIGFYEKYAAVLNGVDEHIFTRRT